MEINNNDEETCLENFLNSDKCILVVNLLSKFKIRLWELPDLSGQCDELLDKLSDESGLVEHELKDILIKLQRHSLKKLEENKKFQKDGTCVFKLKLIGHKIQQTIEANITLTGKDLKDLIINKLNLTCNDLKIICNGKIINESTPLSLQEGIKNHSTLMVMCVYDKVISDLKENTREAKMIDDIKDAVTLLTNEKIKNYENFSRSLKLQNQNGVTLRLSENDERCLTIAMILHEKSKALIRQKQFLKALILLAEADNEFKMCQDKKLLESVDNYGLLNLDIIWCYLNLENLSDLKNAEERLQICESSFKKSYGSDLSRLSSIKNDVNKYTPIFIRLNVLKGILNYHKGKKKECRDFLDLASKEMKKISVDDDKISQVMSMGFSNTEAKLALRATFNDVDAAVEQIFKKKRLLEEAKQVEKQKLLEEKYGRCMSTNQPIDPKILNDLMQFGYSEKKAARAVIQANNDFNLALDYLQENDSERELDDKEEELLASLTSMGFDLELCKMCIKNFGQNLQKSLDFLTSNKNENFETIKSKLEQVLPSCSKTEEMRQELEKAIDAQKILSSLASEMPEDDEAYLDFNTDEDLFFINKYNSLLEC